MPAVVSRGPVRPLTLGSTIEDAFRRNAARDPAAIAVVDGGRRLSYAQVAAAADAYAARLAELGVGPGSRVPFTCRRSAEFVAAALAVMRLGAAYAGIDTRWPRPRIAGIVQRLRPPVVVAGPDDPPDLLAGSDAPVWVPDPPVERAAGAGTRPAPAGPVGDGDTVCCVYFTSGSTGEPKGVLARHKGLLRLFEPPSFARFGPGVTMPVAASTAWDGLSMELWSMLTTGGTAVIVREPYLDAATLRRVVAEDGVTTAMLTTSLFVMIVDEDPGALTGLDQVLAAGEQMPSGPARRFLAAHPGSHLFNVYGPAEVGFATPVRDVRPADCDRPDGVPIGSPVANTELYIVNSDAPELDGREGELYIGGEGVGEGYADDPDLTARRFVDIQTEDGLRRVHRSGDLVRVGPDGLMSYRGRADRQVKIRGLRIEPGETEHAMRSLPGVRSAAVVPLPQRGGGYRDLVGCYTSDRAEEHPDGAARLLTSLRAVLPSYLVPVAVRRVDRLPLRPNGKLDAERVIELVRAGAAASDGAADGAATGDGAAAGVRPAGGAELAVISDAFASVLRRPDVSPDASAFDLGATSLDAGRICARLSQRLGRPVPLSVFMAGPTVAAVADWLGRTDRAGSATAGPAGANTGVSAGAGAGSGRVAAGAVPLSHAQTGFWYAHLLAPGDPAYHSAIVFDIAGPVGPEALVQGLADVQDRHEALRARYGPGGQPVAVVDASRPLPLVRCADRDAVVAALAAPFDLAGGEVWRAALAVRPDGATLGGAVHHIAFDGWSEAVFTRDLSVAYAARLAGTAPVFEVRAPALAELAAAQQRRLASVELAPQRAFWRRHLADLPELRLPDGDGTGVGAVHAGTFPAATIARHARGQGATPFALLATAYAAALAEVSGQSDFGVGVPVAQRDIPGATDAVGCLLTTLCLRLPAPGGDLLRDLAAARPVIADAFAAQDVPFPEVVRLVGPARTGRNPLFDVLLALQDTPPADLSLAGCTVAVQRPTLAMSVGLVAEARTAGNGALGVQLFHDRSRVSAATASAVAAALARLLGGLADR